ncbi:MAG TPA: uL15m family ribosomal protein, partial [Candidatus Dojkabacteria bacterium]|nr:uL15m family ribosomal protein [Candidatus Dojkabacteria bacterium]
GDGKLTKKISVEGIPTSENAKEKILKAGGVIK